MPPRDANLDSVRGDMCAYCYATKRKPESRYLANFAIEESLTLPNGEKFGVAD